MSDLFLPDFMIEGQVRDALHEDLGRAGDITTNAIVPVDQTWRGAIVARQTGVIAGSDLARVAFRMLDPTLEFMAVKPDGSIVYRGDVIARMQGTARAILSAERVALNFMGHLSGIATETRKLVDAARPHKAHICCTRKTTPGLRMVENMRLGLVADIIIALA